jgi:hypothetical protein
MHQNYSNGEELQVSEAVPFRRAVLTADGKGKGEAKTDDGSKTFVMEGTWEIKGDTFCHTWAALDDGKEVCETSGMTDPKKVKVMNGNREIGVNSWD